MPETTNVDSTPVPLGQQPKIAKQETSSANDVTSALDTLEQVRKYLEGKRDSLNASSPVPGHVGPADGADVKVKTVWSLLDFYAKNIAFEQARISGQ